MIYKFIFHVASYIALLNPALASDAEVAKPESDVWHVKTQEFLCAQAVLDKYRQQAGNQIIIFLSDCPETDVAAILQKRTINSSSPDVSLKSNSQENPAEVITFRKDELNCVAKLAIDESKAVIQIKKKPCE